MTLDKVIAKSLDKYSVEYNDRLMTQIMMVLITEYSHNLPPEMRKKYLDLLKALQTAQDIILRIHPDFRLVGVLDHHLESINKVAEAIWEEIDENPPERRRPEKAENRQASEIYKILKADGMDDCWKCCSIISEIFIGAGIKPGPLKKMQEALYNKLSRE